MNTAGNFEQLRELRTAVDEPFGLVPTMGALHEGHLSLVRRARAECAAVGVSIFVNPTQFAPQEDLEAYPRDLERDLKLLASEAVDLVWTPDAEQMYPAGYQTWVEVEQLTQLLEGEHRPGHFRGVATVVAKLFNAFAPQRAYFGQKDYQQALVVQRMAQDLNFPLEVVVCPTVREADGLAMSSRNAYLDPEQRSAAVVLYQALQAAVKRFEGGERQAHRLRQTMSEVLAGEPLARPQYVSVADPENLHELEGELAAAVLSMAVYLGDIRLIDNMLIGAN